VEGFGSWGMVGVQLDVCVELLSCVVRDEGDAFGLGSRRRGLFCLSLSKEWLF